MTASLDDVGRDRKHQPRKPLRQAREIKTVRRLAKASTALGAALWGLVLGAPAYLQYGYGEGSSAAVLFTVQLVLLGALVGCLAWMRRLPMWAAPVMSASAALGLYAMSVSGSVAIAVIAGAATAAAICSAATVAIRTVGVAVPSDLRFATLSWLAASAAGGALLTAIAMAIAGSQGVKVGTFWLAIYAAAATLAAALAAIGAEGDIARARARDAARAARSQSRAQPRLLEVSGVEVSYGSVQVLFGVDMQLDAGELVALLGTNGAGKSTLLRAVAGFHRPHAGAISFEGEDITGLLPEEVAELGVVLVPGGRPIFPELTVMENLRIGAFLPHRSRAAFEKATAPIFDVFPRLAERHNQMGGVLSGGERQMLAIAQSMYTNPKVLLIDELSLGLAPAVVDELLTVVRGIADSGAGVVLVEQSVNVALSVVERALFMEKGEVRFSGEAAGLLDRPDVLRSVFLEGAARHVEQDLSRTGGPAQ